jgi:hypothetical protein
MRSGASRQGVSRRSLYWLRYATDVVDDVIEATRDKSIRIKGNGHFLSPGSNIGVRGRDAGNCPQQQLDIPAHTP